MLPGEIAYRLKAERGLPLDITIDVIMGQQGTRIEWPGFIDAARRNGWFDFQILLEIEHALQDAATAREVAAAIMDRCRYYVMQTLGEL